MANLGKFITAAGGAIVAVFSLVAWITVLASDEFRGSTFTGLKANAVIQGLIMMGLGALMIVGGLVLYDKVGRSMCCIAGTAIFLATTLVPSQLAAGGMNFYIILGGLSFFFDPRQRVMMRAAFADVDESLIVGQLVQHVQYEGDVVELEIDLVFLRFAHFAELEEGIGKHVYIGDKHHVQIHFLGQFSFFLFVRAASIGFGRVRLILVFFGVGRLSGADFAFDFRGKRILSKRRTLPPLLVQLMGPA